MRRIIFYLSVSLLAFGIGSGVVFKFYWKTVERPLIVENIVTKKEKVFTEKEVSPKVESFQGMQFTCEDKQLRDFWFAFFKEKGVLKQFLENYPNNVFIKSYPYKVLNCSDLLTVKNTFDLNDDGKADYGVSLHAPSCGAKDNCPFMVFVEDNGKYKKLLFHEAMVTSEIQAKKSGKFHNIKIFFNEEPYGAYVEIYKFNGKKYKVKNCYSEWTDGSLELIKCWDFNNP